MTMIHSVLSYSPNPYRTHANGNGASFTGSHVQYNDFDCEGLAEFLMHDGPVSDIIKGFGQVSKTYYKIAGELVGKRDLSSPTIRYSLLKH